MGSRDGGAGGPHPARVEPYAGRKHPARLPAEYYRVPGAAVLVTICAAPSRVLAEPPVCGAVVDAMARAGHRRGVRVHVYCLMTDHLHALVSAFSDTGDVQAWLRYTKAISSRAVGGGLWLRSYWDRHARRDEDVARIAEYILCNPVRGGLCEEWYEWPHLWSQWHPESPGRDPNRPPARGSNA